MKITGFLRWGIYIIVFCLPLYLVRFKVFGVPTTILEMMIYVLFVIWLIKSFNLAEFIKIIKENRLLFLAIFLIIFGVSLATIHSWDLKLSAGILKAWFLDPFLFFIVFVSIIKSLDDIKKVFYSFIVSGFVVSVISLVYLFLGKLNIDGRLQGFYDSPNYLAMYLAPVFIIVFYCCFLAFFVRPSEANSGLSPSLLRCPSETVPAPGLKTRSKTTLKHVAFIVNCFLLAMVIFFTKSFGAWMGVVGAIGFGSIVWFLRAKKKKIALVLAILLIILCISIYFIKFNSIQGRLSINSRLEIWQRAMDAVVMYPIIGIGPGTFKDFFPSHPVWGVPQPHNLYLAFMLQTGVIGFIGFVLLLLWFFRLSFRASDDKSNNYRLLVSMMMIYILIHGLVDTLYWKNDLSVMFWVIIGMMTIINRLSSNGNEARIV